MDAIQDRRSNRDRDRVPQRRRYPRVRIPGEVYFESRERMLVARVRDLNLRGAFLDCFVPDSPGNRALLRLLLPGSPSMLRIEAEVLWSREEGGRAPRGMAVRFLQLEAWQQKRLAAALIGRGGLRAFPGLVRAAAA